MFFVRGDEQVWCLPCAIAHFVGTTGAIPPEKIEAFINDVLYGVQRDSQGNLLDEIVRPQQLEGAYCARCEALLSQLMIYAGDFQGEKRFMQSPEGEWVPCAGRGTLTTDLNPGKWDRKNYVPFEAVPVLTWHMRVLVAVDGEHVYRGTLLYADAFVCVVLYDQEHLAHDAPVVTYPVGHPGLYVDNQPDEHSDRSQTTSWTTIKARENGMSIERQGDKYRLFVPAWRDVEEETILDLVVFEEITRYLFAIEADTLRFAKETADSDQSVHDDL